MVLLKQKSKKESIASDLSLVLEKLDEKAEERELKRVQLEAELEEKRREKEREHEMQMQGMMLSFMQQMVSTMARGHSSSAMPPVPSYDTRMPPLIVHRYIPLTIIIQIINNYTLIIKYLYTKLFITHFYYSNTVQLHCG